MDRPDRLDLSDFVQRVVTLRSDSDSHHLPAALLRYDWRLRGNRAGVLDKLGCWDIRLRVTEWQGKYLFTCAFTEFISFWFVKLVFLLIYMLLCVT